MKKIFSLIFLLYSLTSFAQLEAGNYQYGYKVKCDSCLIDGKLKVTATSVGSASQLYVLGSDGYMHTMAASLISGGSSAVNQLQFTIAADGDSVFTNAAFASWPGVIVIREGEEQALTTQYIYDSSLGKITLRPSALAGEKVTIKYGNYNIAVSGTGSGGGAILEYLTFPTVTSGLIETSHLWQASTCGSPYPNYGLSDKKLLAGTDGYIQFQMGASSVSENCILAFNTSNVNEGYITSGAYNYEAGVYVQGGVLYRFNNSTAQSSTGFTVGTDDFVRIVRASGTLKAQVAPNASGVPGTWVDAYTFTYTAALLYVNQNIPCFTNFKDLKIYNAQ